MSITRDYAPWFGLLCEKANMWLDSEDPTFQGRPT